jgi:hypothetical protein
MALPYQWTQWRNSRVAEPILSSCTLHAVETPGKSRICLTLSKSGPRHSERSNECNPHSVLSLEGAVLVGRLRCFWWRERLPPRGLRDGWGSIHPVLTDAWLPPQRGARLRLLSRRLFAGAGNAISFPRSVPALCHSHPHWQRTESHKRGFLRSALQTAHDLIHIVVLHRESNRGSVT